MSRRLILTAIMSASLGVWGQSPAQPGTAPTSGSAQPNQDLNNGGTNSGVVIQNGYVTGAAGNGVLATPTVTFASPAPTAGISNAGRAGITANTPVNTGIQSSLESSTVVYTNAAPVNPAVENLSTPAPAPTRIIDVGPSYYSDTLAGASRVSLGEVAAQFKAAKGAVNARTLTNDDVQKMVSDKTGVTVAKNMPPLGPGAAPQSGGAAPGAQTTQSAQSSASTTQQNQGGQQAGTPPPAANQGQAGSEATAGNATTPQINQNQQSNDAQGKSKLPATSTLLPLFGLLGVLSGGLGLWFRKWRR